MPRLNDEKLLVEAYGKIVEAYSIDRRYINKRIQEFNNKQIGFEQLVDGISVDLGYKAKGNINAIKSLAEHLRAATNEYGQVETNADELLQISADLYRASQNSRQNTGAPVATPATQNI